MNSGYQPISGSHVTKSKDFFDGKNKFDFGTYYNRVVKRIDTATIEFRNAAGIAAPAPYQNKGLVKFSDITPERHGWGVPKPLKTPLFGEFGKVEASIAKATQYLWKMTGGTLGRDGTLFKSAMMKLTHSEIKSIHNAQRRAYYHLRNAEKLLATLCENTKVPLVAAGLALLAFIMPSQKSDT